MTSPIEQKIDDWQKIVNKPVFTRDGKDIGVVESIQAERIIATFGPITPNKYLIPKSSIVVFDELGVVRLKEDGDFVEHHSSLHELNDKNSTGLGIMAERPYNI